MLFDETGGPEVLRVQDLELPAPGPGEIQLHLSAHGVYADRVVLPEAMVVPRPAEVDAVTAAAAWLTYTTAHGALDVVAGVRPGDHVLITGASSGVGTAAIQVVRRAGAVPIATTRTEAKRGGRPTVLPMNWPLSVHGYATMPVFATPQARRRAAAYLTSGLLDGTLRPEIAEVFDGPDSMERAHRLMESHTHTGKIVVRP
ncbi:zinc-binding dehydrogenase [Streptomyces sp. MNP-20]|uniref:zinc-binding dehydrogenase n=1 Tax=Streptomyces sp. MNP-20 TaxID=2721165 RepID=UPI001554406B|nr:zinc-binding dehydrogenase [Streptomyces sp. MNP-20]